MASVWLITGIPGAGKTTVARLLAGRFERGAHIEADHLQEWIVSGSVWPGDKPAAESVRQVHLNVRNQCLLARSYVEEGFEVVIDYVILGPERLREYRSQLPGTTVRLVILSPGKHVAAARDAGRPKSLGYASRTGVSIAERWAHLEDALRQGLSEAGLWVDSSPMTAEETVEFILQRVDEAVLPDELR